MKRKLLLFVVMAAMLAFCSTAFAETIDTIYSQTYSICNPNDTNSYVGTGPFATLQVTLNDTQNTAEFVFTTLGKYVFGDGQAIDINVGGTFNAPATTISTTGGNTPQLTVDYPSTTQMDGFGKFNIQYSAANFGNSGEFTSATIDLTTVSASSLAQLLILNDDGYFAAAHLRLDDETINPDGKTFKASNCGAVPLPGAILLLGAGLARLTAYARRRKED